MWFGMQSVVGFHSHDEINYDQIRSQMSFMKCSALHYPCKHLMHTSLHTHHTHTHIHMHIHTQGTYIHTLINTHTYTHTRVHTITLTTYAGGTVEVIAIKACGSDASITKLSRVSSWTGACATCSTVTSIFTQAS